MNSMYESVASGAVPSFLSNSITLRMPLLAFHPYNNRRLYNKHVNKYKELLPTAIPQSNYNHECLVYNSKLTRASQYFNQEIYIQVFNVIPHSDFIRRLERFLVEGKITNSTKFIEKYIIILAAKELYFKSNLVNMHWFPDFYLNFIEEFRNSSAFGYIFYIIYQCSVRDPFVRPEGWGIPREFLCLCDFAWTSHQHVRYDFSDEDYDERPIERRFEESYESTGLISSLSDMGRALACSMASSYYALRAGNIDPAQITNDFIFDLSQLVANFNIYTLVWAFVKLINRLFNIPNILNIIVETFKYCYDSIIKLLASSAQQQSEEYESTSSITSTIIPPGVSESWFENYFKQIQNSTPIICSVMATLLVICTGLLMGSQVCNEKSMLTKSRARRVAEAFHVVAKTGSSVERLYQILVVWPKWVYEIAYEYIIGNDITPLEEMLQLAEVVDPPFVNRRDFFKEIDYLSNPVNTISISRNDELRQKLVWCSNILTDMSYQIANKPLTAVKPHISQWIYTKMAHVRSSIISISRLPCSYAQRFVPFWLNLIGDSGVGKTTLVPDILNRIREVLKNMEEHLDTLPDDDANWLYSLNFASKHMTGYFGQYCVFIDDVFQDATPVGDATPSPLLLIQMASSQPFSTIQASLADKGIDFTSKIIVSTSNVYNINRKEINCQDALIRRMNVRCHVVLADEKYLGDPKDDLLTEIGHHRNIVFEIWSSDGGNLLGRLNYKNFILYVVDMYIKWYRVQKKLLERPNNPINVDAIIKDLEAGVEIDKLNARDYRYRPTTFKCDKHKIRGSSNNSSSSEETIPKMLPSTSSSSSSDIEFVETITKKSPLKKLISKTKQVVSKMKDPQTSETDQNSKQITVTAEIHNTNDLEPTRSLMCKLFSSPSIKHVSLFLPNYESKPTIQLEQFDCDCDECLSINRSYKEHRINMFATLSDILTISEFKALSSGFDSSNDVSSDHINRSNNYWSKIKEILTSIAKHPLTIIITSLATLAGIWYTFYFKSREQHDITAVQYSTGPNKVAIKRARINNLTPIRFEATNKIDNEFENELRIALPNQNTYDLVYNRIIKDDAMCVLKYRLPDTTKCMSNSALRIGGTCILTNNHFFSQLKPNDIFEVVITNRITGMNTSTQVFNPDRCIQLGDSDCAIYKCDNHLKHAKSLVNHFVDKDIPERDHHCLAVTIYDPNLTICPVIVPNVIAKPFCKQGYYDNATYSILNTFSTNLPVVQGQSGSLLISVEPSSQNRILGILVCRSKSSNCGYFKPIPRSSIQEAMNKLNVDQNLHVDIEQDLEVTCATPSIPKLENISYQGLNFLGKIPPSKQVSQAISTKFVPSLIQDPDKIEFQPAVLHPSDERMRDELCGKPIIYRSIQGFDEPIGAINTYELDIAAEELAIEYQGWEEPPGFCRVLLDNYQMVNGVKPYLKKLDMRTSPGYPFVKFKSATDLGKYKWFQEISPRHEQDGKVFQMNDELREIVENREIKARQGIKTSTIAYMCLKDELRPNQKIIDGATRVFTCLPMDYNLLIRKYFGAFIIIQHHNAGKISSCVGVNPATDWYTMWQRLETLNNEWEDFDYKNWDQHLHPELIAKVADIISMWYGDNLNSENARVRRVLVHDLTHTTIMVKDHLFQKSSGQCSGCAITAELNCIIHDLLMYYIYRLMCKDNKYQCNLSIYRRNVQVILYGDDIVKSTKPGFFFTGDRIKPYLDKLGMHITPGDKTSTTFTFKPPNEILFLKRSFTLDPNSDSTSIQPHNVRAPLRKDIIDNIYQWVRKSEDPILAVRDNCETALRETFMYGKQVFNNQKSIINSKINEFNKHNIMVIQPITMMYENLLADFANQRLDLVGFETNDQDDGFLD